MRGMGGGQSPTPLSSLLSTKILTLLQKETPEKVNAEEKQMLVQRGLLSVSAKKKLLGRLKLVTSI